MAIGSGVAPSVDLGFVRETLALSRATTRQHEGAAKGEKAAREFESILLGHWLEEAEQSLASAPGGSDDDEEDPAHFQLQGMGMQALGTAITQAGGIGIAALIRRQFQRAEGTDAIPPAATTPKPATGQNRKFRS